MASASAATVQPASVVGNAFVSQYYNVLHQSPHVVHRFYTDESKLTRAGGPNATVDTVTTQQDIHNKVMSLDHANFKAEIKTVDSQDSLKGGVLVMVTGSLSNKASGKRNFVQTFFLAPQEKGYFVLNDVLRYLDDESEVVVNHGGYAMANGITEPVSSVPETEPSRGDSITSDEGYVLAEREEEPEQAEPAVPVAHVAAPVVEESAVPAAPTPAEAPAAAAAAEVSHGEAPKKSYASIVLAMKEHGGPIVPIRAAPLKHTPTSSPAPALPAKVAAPSPSHEVAADEHHPASDSEADKRSIFVKNLPLNVTESQLDAEFKKFGPIKAGGGVQIRTFKGPQQQQGYCYAFIEFEDQQSAQNAVEGTNVQISGRTVYVESRKTPTGGRGRGREGRGEGRGRGRGDYAGGRGEYSREGRGDYGSGRGGGRGGYGREGGNYGRGEGGRYASTNTNTNNVGGGNHAASNAEANATSDDGFRQRPQRRSSNRNGGRHAAAPAVVAAE